MRHHILHSATKSSSFPFTTSFDACVQQIGVKWINLKKLRGSVSTPVYKQAWRRSAACMWRLGCNAFIEQVFIIQVCDLYSSSLNALLMGRRGQGRTECWSVECDDATAGALSQRQHDVAPRESAAAVTVDQDDACV